MKITIEEMTISNDINNGGGPGNIIFDQYDEGKLAIIIDHEPNLSCLKLNKSEVLAIIKILESYLPLI